MTLSAGNIVDMKFRGHFRSDIGFLPYEIFPFRDCFNLVSSLDHAEYHLTSPILLFTAKSTLDEKLSANPVFIPSLEKLSS